MQGKATRKTQEDKDHSGLSARRRAIWILSEVLDRNRPLSDVLQTPDRNQPDPRDRAFTHAIVATSLRRKGQIDGLLAQFLERPLPAKARKVHHILTTGMAQLLFLETPPHAAIDSAVRLCGEIRTLRPFKGLTNAILRKTSREAAKLVAQQDVIRLNTPDWLWRRWCENYGETQARAIAEIHLNDPPLDISVKSDLDNWAETLGGQILATGSIRLENAGAIEKLAGFGEGAWWVQDAAASLPVQLLGNVAGQTILDLCAAPGGKTAQLAARGANVIAVDQSKSRLRRLQQNLDRLKLKARIEHSNALNYRPQQQYDAILLDAPCLATGTIRRHPDIPYLKREADIETIVPIQTKLLQHAASLLKPGGTLIYCTCSLEPEEGEHQISNLLQQGKMTRIPIRKGELQGLDHAVTHTGDLRTLPSLQAAPGHGGKGMDGFFAARLSRST